MAFANSVNSMFNGGADEGVGDPVEEPAKDPVEFTPPEIYFGRHGRLTNGTYALDVPGMGPHLPNTALPGKSVFLSGVDAEKAVLDAAAYADAHGFWVGSKAKVYVENGPVGVVGRTGELTNYINIYRSKNGFVHGAPGSAP